MNAEHLDCAALAGSGWRYDFPAGVCLGSPMPEVEPPDKGAPLTPRSNGRGGRVIRVATAKEETFAIMVNDVDTIGVIVLLSWNAAQRNGKVCRSPTGLTEVKRDHGR